MSRSTMNAPARTNRSDATSKPRALVQTSLAPGTVDLPSLVPLMYALMCRNIASDGFAFSDPQAPGDYSKDSRPGCIIAAPSFPADTAGIDEDYVFNWVRDGGNVARAAQQDRLYYVHISAPDRGAVHDSWIPWETVLGEDRAGVPRAIPGRGVQRDPAVRQLDADGPPALLATR